MKMGVLQKGIWVIFRPTFQKNLGMLGVEEPNEFMKKVKMKYYDILRDIPEFGENDILIKNIISAAMYAAVYLNLEKKPSIDVLADYYETAMGSNNLMKFFLRRTNYYTKKTQNKLKKGAERSQLSLNPYSWRYKLYEGETINEFDAIFDRCGIWHMMKELGIPEATPALCRYDYGMAKETNTIFTREQTLAGGGSVCDCHYKKKK